MQPIMNKSTLDFSQTKIQIKHLSFFLQLSRRLLFLVVIASYQHEIQHTDRFKIYNLRAHIHAHVESQSNCARHNKLKS